MLVKIMSDDGLPDGDYRKEFRLIADAIDIRFTREPYRYLVGKSEETPSGFLEFEGPHVHVRCQDGTGESIRLRGNVYILDEFGKTIDRFVIDAPRPPAPPQPKDPGPQFRNLA